MKSRPEWRRYDPPKRGSQRTGDDRATLRRPPRPEMLLQSPALRRGVKQRAEVSASSAPRAKNSFEHGFPISHRAKQKMRFGFMTGDLVLADIPKSRYAGRWVGWVAVRASGYFDVKDGSGQRVCQGISHKYIKLLQRADGW